MNRDFYRVLGAQFLTAFADNAVLFTIITMVLQNTGIGSWYVPALQACFLIAFVLFAPLVGRFADVHQKRRVLVGANYIKAGGAGLLIFHVEPLLAYATIGLGAAAYSPAKYGILPELASEKQLVQANGWIEGSTILAILSGTFVGAWVAERSITLALIIIVMLYIGSALIATSIQHNFISGKKTAHTIKSFIHQIKALLSTPRARFATLGVSLFWSAATVLRVLLVAWAPVVLYITGSTDIALLTLFVALGIAVGAFVAPKIIPMAYLRRTRMSAYLMGAIIVILATMDSLSATRVMLFLAGVSGGIFVVPINAALQEIGHKTIGSGGAVAIQNFFENFAMLIASGVYTYVAGVGADPVATMIGLGVIVVITTTIISWRLPKDTGVLI